MNDIVPLLPHFNAALNGVTTLLLLIGLLLIKQRREIAHRNIMLAAFGVSVVFLASYLTYHYFAGSRKFPLVYGDAIRYVYLTILLTHVVLAAAVPVLAVGTIYHGLANHRPAHLRWAKITFPIWLYVSITGLVVYLMLYILYPAPGGAVYNERNGSLLVRELDPMSYPSRSRRLNSFRMLRTLFLLPLVWLALVACAEACPTCKDQLAGDPTAEGLARGFYYSILFMLSMPPLILGGLCTYFYYLVKTAESPSLVEQPCLEQAGLDS